MVRYAPASLGVRCQCCKDTVEGHEAKTLVQQRAPFVKRLPHLHDHTSKNLEPLRLHRLLGDMLLCQGTNGIHLVVEGIEFVRTDRGNLFKDGQQPLLHLFPVLAQPSITPFAHQPGAARADEADQEGDERMPRGRY